MAGISSALALIKALGLVSWRDVQSFRSLTGQNFFLFALLVAYQQVESAEFFLLVLAVIMLVPLSADAMEKIPFERRIAWPVSGLEWGSVRLASLAFNPSTLLAVVLLARTGWRIAISAAIGGVLLQVLISFAKRFLRTAQHSWLRWIPAPPGTLGAIVRLQWREMLATLDPYVAFALLVCAEAYRASGKALDPAMLPVLSVLITLAMSTETQVLFGIDGAGAKRYRQWPLRGWQILLAKDLAFLSLLAVLVLPLDFLPGFIGGVAALAIGHHRSVFSAVPQKRWRFTSGAIFPDGFIQVAVLFAIGLQIRTVGWPLVCACFLGWLASLFSYGWQWDRRRTSEQSA